MDWCNSIASSPEEEDVSRWDWQDQVDLEKLDCGYTMEARLLLEIGPAGVENDIVLGDLVVFRRPNGEK